MSTGQQLFKIENNQKNQFLEGFIFYIHIYS